jgi:cell division protein FtsW (lipid II flippase)
MILWASNQLARRELNGRFDTNVMKLITPAFVIILFLIMLGHDLGTASVVAMILVGLLFVSGIKLRILGSLTAIGALALTVCTVSLIRNTHWFSDLFGGLLLGSALLVLIIAIDRVFPSDSQLH